MTMGFYDNPTAQAAYAELARLLRLRESELKTLKEQRSVLATVAVCLRAGRVQEADGHLCRAMAKWPELAEWAERRPL